MFNLNIPPTSLLGIEGSGLCSTPKTPEIVNSLIAMSNPLDSYNFSTTTLTPTNAAAMRNFANAQAAGQDSSHSSCSASPLDSPAGTNTTPTVQQTCSQLIKAGLKLSIQSKRKLSTCDSSSGSEQPKSKCSRRDEDCEETTEDDSEHKSTPKGLTPEDEDRRRRRRERNKIAATKCRLKKRERTQNLVKESKDLEAQNSYLISQMRYLDEKRREVLEMLQSHAPTCVSQTIFNIPPELLESPYMKYIAERDLRNNNGGSSGGDSSSGNGCQMPELQAQGGNNNSNNGSSGKKQPPRTVIPPVSTIKFSRSNGLQAVAAVNAAAPVCSISPVSVGLAQSMQQLPAHQQLPSDYCKSSPTPLDLDYLNSPTQDSICLPSMQAHTPTAHQDTSAIAHQLSDYFPDCDNSLNMRMSHAGGAPPTRGDSNSLLSAVVSPIMSAVSTPTEFVKNELVDSQSPYTTAQSAERFLFENNCDSFVDIKHAVSVLPGHHGGNGVTCLGSGNNNNNNNNMLDFHTSLIGGAGSIAPFHDQISLKNDFLHDTDLLGHLTGDASEFVDLDTGETSAFMTNGGCLA